MRRKKCWQVQPERPEQVKELSARHGLPPLVARLLVNRGLNGVEEIEAFLDPSLERLYPPFGLADLEKAATRLGQAVRRGEPVAVYGDYDCRRRHRHRGIAPAFHRAGSDLQQLHS